VDKVFVTGTDTEVGKTVVAAAIANTAVRDQRKVGVMKPVVTGLDDYPKTGQGLGWEDAKDLPDHELLRLAARSDQTDREIAPYRFKRGTSPHLAASVAKRKIEPERLRPAAKAAAEGTDLFICEGVGGLLVPLNAEYMVSDLARDLDLPLVVVSRPKLGTINHTLLTLQAARDARLEVIAVVLNKWPQQPGAMEKTNLVTIAALGDVRVLTFPRVDLTSPENWPDLDPWADPTKPAEPDEPEEPKAPRRLI
jgi:dethiobiotin synthetase